MILAVLNLNVSTMPPTKFQLYRIYHSGADLISRFARWPSILELNRYSNSKSPFHPNASHQLWAQSDLPFGSRCGLKTYKMATMADILDIGRNDFRNSESLCYSDASHQVSAQSKLQFERCHLKIFKIAGMAAILYTGIE